MTVEEMIESIFVATAQHDGECCQALDGQVAAYVVAKLRAGEELAKFIDDRLGNHALVINQGSEPDKLRALLQTYSRAGNDS